MVFKFYLIILETLSCLLLLAVSLHQLDVCKDLDISRRTVTPLKQKFCANVSFLYQIVYVFLGLGLLC